jgi:hypothetical protein
MRRVPLWLPLMSVGVLLLAIPFATSCGPAFGPTTEPPVAAPATATVPTGKPSVPLDMGLSLPDPPALGQVATLTFWVKPLIDAPDTSVQITLPEGLELVQGSLRWQGTIPANETRELQVSVRPVRTGPWTILAGAQSHLPGGALFGRQTSLSVDIDGAQPVATEGPSSQETPSSQSGAESLDKPSAPVEMALSFSTLPLLGQEVTLTFSVRPLIDAPNTTAQITLPEGFELVGGRLNWNGDLAANEAQGLQVQVKAVRTGFWTITAESVTHIPGGAVFGRSVSLYVDLTETDATVSEDAKHR